jgi:hypothetical protein
MSKRSRARQNASAPRECPGHFEHLEPVDDVAFLQGTGNIVGPDWKQHPRESPKPGGALGIDRTRGDCVGVTSAAPQRNVKRFA